MIKTVTKFGDEVIINEKNITVCTLTMDKSIFINFVDGSSVIIKEPFDAFFKKLKACDIEEVSINSSRHQSPIYTQIESGTISETTETTEQTPIKEGLVTLPKPKGKPGRKPGFKLNKS